MTGFDIYNRCIALLGYTNQAEEFITEKAFKARFPEILNQVLLDLKLNTINDLSAEINLSFKQTDALINGCAMLLTLSEGDVDKNRIFTAVYNGKRSAALSEKSLIEDVIPTV